MVIRIIRFRTENDWYLFESWMNGKTIYRKLRDRLYPYYEHINSKGMNDEDVFDGMGTLSKRLAEIRILVEFKEEVPLRLKYMHLLEILDEEFEEIVEGFWHLDGCTGSCPYCFQRPWCELGCRSCWSEDEKVGKMFLIEPVKEYVSPSSNSLQLLQKYQAEEDKEFEEFKNSQNHKVISVNPFPFDPDKEDDFPF